MYAIYYTSSSVVLWLNQRKSYYVPTIMDHMVFDGNGPIKLYLQTDGCLVYRVG